jgi:hypothetical protein
VSGKQYIEGGMMMPVGWHMKSFDILWNEIYNGVRKKSTFTRLRAYEIFHLPPEPVLFTFLFGEVNLLKQKELVVL